MIRDKQMSNYFIQQPEEEKHQIFLMEELVEEFDDYITKHPNEDKYATYIELDIDNSNLMELLNNKLKETKNKVFYSVLPAEFSPKEFPDMLFRFVAVIAWDLKYVGKVKEHEDKLLNGIVKDACEEIGNHLKEAQL